MHCCLLLTVFTALHDYTAQSAECKDETYLNICLNERMWNFYKWIFQLFPASQNIQQLPDARRGWGMTRCELADLSLTPLLPVPWPLQLWGDRGAIISGSHSTKAGTQCSHFITGLWWADPSQLKRTSCGERAIWRRGSTQRCPAATLHTRTYTQSRTHPLTSNPALFAKTVITLGFSCWLYENPLSTELGRQPSDGCHTYIHTYAYVYTHMG